MHRVGTIGSTANTSRPRKERRLTYVLANSNNSKHCSGINCLAVPQCESEAHNTDDVLFSGSRDGTLKRWDLSADAAVCSATFESHADWVNDVVLIAGETLVSCSSDTTIKTWRAFSEGACTRTFRQHSDYVTSLAAAKQNSVVASGGLGGEVFLWDLEAATVPISKAANDKPEEIGLGGNTVSGGPCQVILNDRVNLADQTFSTASGSPSEVYSPLSLKGHKESVYALAMNEPGTLLVSGGTEKAIRVWDTRTGAKQMKLKGHTDNIRALVLDPSGRLCLSGSSDSMIRLWDIGQQRCIHSYAVHTDSVWSLASTPSFNHVYSGGRDLSVYLTDLASRESTLICVEQHPVLKIALHGGEWFWLATSDSSIHKWRTKEHTSVKNLQRASSFVAGTLPFARARACLEGSPLVPLNAEPAYIIPGTAGIVKHAILNNRQHVLTKDAVGVVKLWEITRGAVIKDYGKVSFEEKEKELFEMVSVPTWFTMDTRLGSISVHLDTPQCFSAEMYAMDLHVPDSSEDQKVNLGQETLRGLFAHWFNRRQQRTGMQPATNGDAVLGQGVFNNHVGSERRNTGALAAFQFSTTSPPSIITEGSKGGPWRKKITDLDSSDDEKCFPSWCMEYLLHNRCPAKEHTKCSFYLHAYEGTPLQVVTQGKLSAPRILRVQKVINYVLEKMILEKPLEATAPESGNSSSGHVIKQQQQQQPQPQPQVQPQSQSQPQLQLQQQHQLASNPTGARCIKAWQQKTKCDVEILCNNQVLAPDMSLATVRTYIWKKPEDLYLQYRLVMNP